MDASVVVKWCLGEGEPKIENARQLLEAHLAGTFVAAVLDLTLYEVGNALAGKGFDGEDLAGMLELLEVWDLEWLGIAGPEVSTEASRLVEAHGLSFYDAAYLAVALDAGIFLVTDDELLLGAAEAEGVGVALAGISPWVESEGGRSDL